MNPEPLNSLSQALAKPYYHYMGFNFGNSMEFKNIFVYFWRVCAAARTQLARQQRKAKHTSLHNEHWLLNNNSK